MQKNSNTWQHSTSKNSKFEKTYGVNTSQTVVCHIAAHQFTAEQIQQSQVNKSMVTIATFDCDFILLQNFLQIGKIKGDPLYKQLLKIRTTYPILHCCLQYSANHKERLDLIGYLIDIYSNIYSVNFTKALEVIKKHPNHPVQFTQLVENIKGVETGEKLYLETPLMINKQNKQKIVTVNLKGQIGIVELSPNLSFTLNNYQTNKFPLKNKALAANYNRFKCKYQSVIIVAVNNNRAPYLFVNCHSISDFQKQKKAQDNYEWMQDQAQISFCSLDPQTSLVAVSTVTQNISIYEMASSKQENNNLFYFLKKRFAFFVQRDIRFSNIDINFNIECIHANKGLVIIITSKEYLLYDIIQRSIKKRGKSSQISSLKWGGIMDRNTDQVATFIVKGYNHINQAQSKVGKPNIHFKTIDLVKKEKY